MIDLVPNLPPQVLGFVASGKVTADDYESTVIPAIESRLKESGKVRIFYHLGPAFTGFTAGAMWDDAKMGIAHLKAWEKIAIVTDVDWIGGAVGIFWIAIPCPVKVFPNAQYAEAAAWIAA